MVADAALGMDITQVSFRRALCCARKSREKESLSLKRRRKNSLTFRFLFHKKHKKNLQKKKKQVGTLTSLFPIAYGMSKFVSGVLGARSSPRLMLAGGLMATAAVNIAFGAGTGMAWFCTFWALNGILQGFGGPCCARILTSWFATKERGTYWGMWNIAHNLGGFGEGGYF